METNFHTYLFRDLKKYNFFMPDLIQKASLGKKIIISVKFWIQKHFTKWVDKHWLPSHNSTSVKWTWVLFDFKQYPTIASAPLMLEEWIRKLVFGYFSMFLFLIEQYVAHSLKVEMSKWARTRKPTRLTTGSSRVGLQK